MYTHRYKVDLVGRLSADLLAIARNRRHAEVDDLDEEDPGVGHIYIYIYIYV